MIANLNFLLILVALLSLRIGCHAQAMAADTAVSRLQVYESFDLPSNFASKYRYALKRVRRVYPLALHAAHVLDSMETAIDGESRKRKAKRIANRTHKDLKNDFKFLLKELYVSEGIYLTKLIYRETGKTAREIISDYKGDIQASLYSTMAAMFEQDLESKYEPNGEDFVIECVIQDIAAGKVKFDSSFVIVDRAHYREDKKAYKKRVRKNKKELRERKRKARKKAREMRRNKKDER